MARPLEAVDEKKLTHVWPTCNVSSSRDGNAGQNFTRESEQVARMRVSWMDATLNRFYFGLSSRSSRV